jgi:hypothetical protein
VLHLPLRAQEQLGARALMVAALTLVICGTLFTIGSLEYPFTGQAEIQPETFEQMLRSFEEP